MYNDLSGMRYDMLTVIHRVQNNSNGHHQYLCQCDCGNQKIISADNLRNGKTHSCGCLKKKMMAEKQYKHGGTGGHNGKSEKLYSIWQSMKDRCSRPSFLQYKDYGGRGIKVCDEWNNSYIAFKEWSLLNGYQVGLTIDRINNNGNYEPNNCRWVSMKDQMNNKRNNHLLSFNGKTQTLTQWAEGLGISRSTLNDRINKKKWPVEKALTTPPQKHFSITWHGVTKDLSEWSKITGISYEVLRNRYHSGLSSDDILTLPVDSTRSSPHLIQYNDQFQSISYFAKQYGINRSTLSRRINMGQSPTDAINELIAKKQAEEDAMMYG